MFLLSVGFGIYKLDPSHSQACAMCFLGGRGGIFSYSSALSFVQAFLLLVLTALRASRFLAFGVAFFFFSTSRKNSEQHFTFPPLAALRPNPCFSESNFKKGKTYPIQKTGSRRNSTSLLRGGGAFWDDHIIMKRG